MGERTTESAPQGELSDFDLLVARPGAEALPGTMNPVYNDTAPLALDFSDRPAGARARASALEWISLVLAVVMPPLGLIVSILARVITRHRHGWTTRVAIAATAVSIVLTIVLGAALVVASFNADDDAAKAAVLARAQPLCAALAKTPGVLDTQGYGWPTAVASIGDTVVSMKAYQAHWAELESLAPASAKAGITAIAAKAAALVSNVETSQSIDRGANLTKMDAVTSASGLPSWVAQYCG